MAAFIPALTISSHTKARSLASSSLAVSLLRPAPTTLRSTRFIPISQQTLYPQNSKSSNNFNNNSRSSGNHSAIEAGRESIKASVSKVEQLHLPPQLCDLVSKFRNVPDVKLRYQQLLFMAQTLPKLDAKYCIPENKVPGCLSTVFVHVYLENNAQNQPIVRLEGDSDAQLTKGLLAFLLKGLDKVEPKQVLEIDPGFIEFSGLSVSLTPGRNNGFLNMVNTIKKKVISLLAEREQQATTITTTSESNDNASSESTTTASVAAVDKPIYAAIQEKLQALEPTVLQIVDNSQQHASHARVKNLNNPSGETHFAIRIVSKHFEPLSLVKRHQLVYRILDDYIGDGKIHALQIDAKTPQEVQAQ